MKKFFSAIIILLVAVNFVGTYAEAIPPNPVSPVLTYQGSIFVDDEPFNGTGFFKVAIVNESGQTLWSNDGSSVDGGEPTGDVSIEINQGIFKLLLGDSSIPGMLDIDLAIFATDENLFLKSWFDDGANGFSEMAPSIQLTTSSFAANAQFLRGYAPDDFFLNSGQISSSQIAPGAVQQTNIAGGAVGTSQIATNSVTGDKITAFSNNNTEFTVGRGQSENVVIYADTAASNNPGLRFDDTTGKWQYSNDGTSWNDIGSGGGGSGTVNSGNQNELAYYAATGTAVSGLATANNGVLVTSGAGAPSISSTLPNVVQGNITSLGTIVSGTWQGNVIADTFLADNLTINGGTVNNSIIGGTTAADGTFRDLKSELDTVVEGGDVTIGQGTTAYAGRILLHDNQAGSSNTTTIKSNDTVGTSFTLTLPADDGNSGEVLSTDGTGNLSWASAGSGDVTGPGSSTDNALTRFDGATGKAIQNSGVTLDDSNNMSGVGTLSIASMGQNWTNAGRTIADLGSVTTADINGGTIDNMQIGQSVADLGTFTTLDATDIEATGTFKLGTANQGDVLYDNGTSMVRLPPGTSGQFLQTQGASANPQWATPAGSGDVVGPGSATDNAITRFDGTTGKLIQNSGLSIDDSNNLSGVNALSIASMGQNWTNAGRTIADLGSVTTADINGGTIDNMQIGQSNANLGTFTTLDATDIEATGTFKLGTTNQGDVLYDNGTSIVRLPPGTSGQVLTAQGAGANPQWSSAGVSYWQRSGTDLSPLNSGDDVLMNAGETITTTDNASVQIAGKPAVVSASATQQIIDSGTTAALAGGTVTTSFNVTFNTAPIVVFSPNSVEQFGNNDTWPYVSATTTTQFTITADTALNGATFNWIAIGAK